MNIPSQLLTINLPQNISQTIIQYWHAGSWLMIPLATVCFFIWFNYLRLYYKLKQALNNNSEKLIEQLKTRLLNHEDYSEIAQWLKPYQGASPRLLRHLLIRLKHGLPFKKAYQQCFLAEMSEYNYSFYILAALVVIAPLLGLLGTVFGMVSTFDAVAIKTGETASMVAGGISQALITTQVGLVMAVPGSFGLIHLGRILHQLKNQLTRIQSHLYIIFE